MSPDSILQWISTYLIHLLFLFIVLYAGWQWVHTRLRLNAWFRHDGYEKVSGKLLSDQITISCGDKQSTLLAGMAHWDEDKQAPTSAWVGKAGTLPCWQFLSKRRRAHSFLRKKNSKRTRYNVTIVKLAHLPPQEFYFLLRPRRVLDALDYALVASDISYDEWGAFGEHYLVETNDGEQLYQRMGSPMRQLLMDVEGVSLELVGQYLILLRINQFFDQRDHLQTERESAELLANYLFDQKASEGVYSGDRV